MADHSKQQHLAVPRDKPNAPFIFFESDQTQVSLLGSMSCSHTFWVWRGLSRSGYARAMDHCSPDCLSSISEV
jgi:hypothetical protein